MGNKFITTKQFKEPNMKLTRNTKLNDSKQNRNERGIVAIQRNPKTILKLSMKVRRKLF